MYIQITTACNMTCDHCCFSATARGERMDRATYMAALQLAIRYGEYITIGGGEPTTHREFFDFLEKAIEFYECGSLEAPPFLVTNGKVKSKAMRLLRYIEEDRPLHVELSQDMFHDPIDPAVSKAFWMHEHRRSRYRYGGTSSDSHAGIRDTSHNIQPWGRAKDTGVWNAQYVQKCVCDDVFVDPKGVVWSCGCKRHKLGMVWHSDVLDGYNREYAHQGGREPDEGFPVLEIESAFPQEATL